MSSSLELALRASTWSFNSRSCLPLRSPCWSAKVSLSLCTGHVTCRSPGFLQPDDPLRCGTAADHFDIVVGNPRAAVNGAYADEAVKMYKDVLPANVEFIQIREVSTLGKGGPVTYVTRAGETCTLQPEVLVIATGSSYKGGLMKNNDCLDKAEWLAKLQKFRASCARSQHIMVVGGGVTGVVSAPQGSNLDRIAAPRTGPICPSDRHPPCAEQGWSSPGRSRTISESRSHLSTARSTSSTWAPRCTMRA